MVHRRAPAGAGGAVPPDFPVVVSSYEIVMADRKHLQRYEWRYLVVDEGHRLKNHDCKLLRELRYLNVQTKLLLTGGCLRRVLPSEVQGVRPSAATAFKYLSLRK